MCFSTYLFSVFLFLIFWNSFHEETPWFLTISHKPVRNYIIYLLGTLQVAYVKMANFHFIFGDMADPQRKTRLVKFVAGIEMWPEKASSLRNTCF